MFFLEKEISKRVIDVMNIPGSSFLKVIGSTCFVLSPQEEHNKLSNCSRIMEIFKRVIVVMIVEDFFLNSCVNISNIRLNILFSSVC